MGNNMEKVLMLPVQEMKNMENGRTVKELDGLEEVNKSEFVNLKTYIGVNTILNLIISKIH